MFIYCYFIVRAWFYGYHRLVCIDSFFFVEFELSPERIWLEAMNHKFNPNTLTLVKQRWMAQVLLCNAMQCEGGLHQNVSVCVCVSIGMRPCMCGIKYHKLKINTFFLHSKCLKIFFSAMKKGKHGCHGKCVKCTQPKVCATWQQKLKFHKFNASIVSLPYSNYSKKRIGSICTKCRAPLLFTVHFDARQMWCNEIKWFSIKQKRVERLRCGKSRKIARECWISQKCWIYSEGEKWRSNVHTMNAI